MSPGMSTALLDPESDVTPAVEPAPPYDDEPHRPDFIGWLRRSWLPVLITALVLATAVGLAVVGSVPPARPLDPDDASPAGARAIVALLRQQGVTVDVIERLDRARSAPDTTVVVPVP
ncbi:MAG: hypothetical protein QOC82_1197, partial [Frankiaceae bacterium]|nr:hypothetical protein [Frankiaceae bacterium]